MLKKLSVGSLFFFTAAIWLFAATFWDTKPYAEWSDKELEKLLQDSPWGDRMSVRTGERGVVAQDDAKGPIMGETEVSVTLLWQSALPIRQALAKAQAKGGPITPEAQAVVERQTDVHVLRIQGLPGSARAAATAKEQLTADTSIKIKNKPDVKPSDIQIGGAPAPAPGGAPGKGKGFGGGGGAPLDLYFVFPKTAGITEADNEIEFVTKLGKLNIRKKYKLKDMVFNGKFEM